MALSANSFCSNCPSGRKPILQKLYFNHLSDWLSKCDWAWIFNSRFSALKPIHKSWLNTLKSFEAISQTLLKKWGECIGIENIYIKCLCKIKEETLGAAEGCSRDILSSDCAWRGTIPLTASWQAGKYRICTFSEKSSVLLEYLLGSVSAGLPYFGQYSVPIANTLMRQGL